MSNAHSIIHITHGQRRNSRVLGLIPRILEHGQGTDPAIGRQEINCDNWATVGQ
jgi:hypothetical protein